MKLKLTLVSVLAFLAFASCDSSDGDSWPRQGKFEFGGNEYNINVARQTFLGRGERHDLPPYFNLRFEGTKNMNERSRSVNFYIIATDETVTQIPEGTYSVTNNPVPTRSAGECLMATFYTPSEEEPRLATGGTITVEREDNMYIIRADCSFDDGFSLKLNFRGMLEYQVVDDGHDH